MADTLTEICAKKREHIAAQKQKVGEQELYERALSTTPPRGFHLALKKRAQGGGIGLIAEIKKASPSRGVIRADFDPVTLAQAYEAGGAACLSVLTDIPYFQGADEYLPAARAASRLPALRKDFMLEPYQILESRALGADCILLILAALSDGQARELELTAQELGMDVLVEVHDEAERDRALTQLRSKLIGINNRDLKTLKVDLATAERLKPAISEHYTVVAESGIATPDDIARLRKLGIDCFLVGESLMREADVAEATKKLLA
ncbi:MAG: indole-3-glycerol phosphate synthase TrpC [Alphaproteobacteria bacterium]